MTQSPKDISLLEIFEVLKTKQRRLKYLDERLENVSNILDRDGFAPWCLRRVVRSGMIMS